MFGSFQERHYPSFANFGAVLMKETSEMIQSLLKWQEHFLGAL